MGKQRQGLHHTRGLAHVTVWKSSFSVYAILYLTADLVPILLFTCVIISDVDSNTQLAVQHVSFCRLNMAEGFPQIYFAP